MRRLLWIGGGVILVVVLARATLFTVGPTEYVYLTQFGQHVFTFDGSDAVNDAGLHMSWPWPVQAVQRLDRRLQYFDLPPTELPTTDDDVPKPGKASDYRIDKMLIVEAYVCWRIADREAVDLFIRTLGSAERAQGILSERINSQLGGAISKMSTKDLINTDAERVETKMKQLWEKLLADLRPELKSEYGVELVDVRLRRFYHSPQVTQDIFQAIKAKRKEKAAEYYGKGKKESEQIRDKADKDYSDMVAAAEGYKAFKDMEGKGKAMAIMQAAHKRDEELSRYLLQMEALKKIIKDNPVTLYLSAHRTFFEGMLNMPHPNGPAPPGAGVGKNKEKGPDEPPPKTPKGGD